MVSSRVLRGMSNSKIPSNGRQSSTSFHDLPGTPRNGINIGFSGGGAAGPCHLGVIQRLSEHPFFASFECIRGTAGSSVGSLPALMMALKYPPKEIIGHYKTIELKKLKTNNSWLPKWWHLYSRSARYSSKPLFDIIYEIIEKKAEELKAVLNEGQEARDITFAQLYQLTGIDFFISATQLFERNGSPSAKEKRFSHLKTPDTTVAPIIYASASAPLHFPTIRLTKVKKGHYKVAETPEEIANSHIYTDGALLNHCPIDAFPPNPTRITFGAAIVEDHQADPSVKKPTKKPITTSYINDYLTGLFNGMSTHIITAKHKQHPERLIMIGRRGVQPDDFDAPPEQLEEIIKAGYDATNSFLEKYNHLFPIPKPETPPVPPTTSNTENAAPVTELSHATNKRHSLQKQKPPVRRPRRWGPVETADTKQSTSSANASLWQSQKKEETPLERPKPAESDDTKNPPSATNTTVTATENSAKQAPTTKEAASPTENSGYFSGWWGSQTPATQQTPETPQPEEKRSSWRWW